MVTSPNLSDQETRALAHARAVTYLQPESWGRSYEVLNDWDRDVLDRLRAHRQFAGATKGIADLDHHRTKLADPGSPTLIQDKDSKGALYVLMPMRV